MIDDTEPPEISEPPQDGERNTPRGKRRAMRNGELGIEEFSNAVGVAPATLRIWELRYDWPKPGRLGNGYRYYTQKQVEVVKFVAELIERGRSISDLLNDTSLGIREGNLPPPPSADRKVVRTDLDFSSVPMPTSDEGKRLRQKMEDALRHSKASEVAFIEAQAGRIASNHGPGVVR
jgi:hypothetical protein